MNDIASDRVGPMLNPPHLGELIRESMDEVGWNVTETAVRLGCERGTLPHLLNEKAGVSANMVLALEDSLGNGGLIVPHEPNEAGPPLDHTASCSKFP